MRNKGSLDIYIIDDNGRNIRQVTFHDGPDSFPMWFPSGRHLAFVSKREDVFGIYRIRVTRRSLKRIVDSGIGRFAISPDGDWVAVPHGFKLLLVEIDGIDQRELWWHGRPVGLIGMPSWSPDGNRIAFTIRMPGIMNDIYVLDIAGENLRQLTKNPGQDLYPAWSPNGRKIAFTSNRGGCCHVYLMDADGANLEWLSKGSQPAWSSDGRRIAFQSTPGDISGIFIMNADGNGVVWPKSRCIFRGQSGHTLGKDKTEVVKYFYQGLKHEPLNPIGVLICLMLMTWLNRGLV